MMMEMSAEVVVALVSLVSTIAGSLCGVLASSRLTTYRIQELEEKVERMYAAEASTKSVHKRLDALEKK